MRSIAKTVFVASIGCWIVAMPARADTSAVDYIDACAAALVPTDIKWSSNDEVKLALLDEMLSQSSSSNQQNFAADVPDLFSGGYQGAQKADQLLRQSIKYSLDHTHQVSLLASYLSQTAADAFDKCVADTVKAPGIHITISSLDPSVSQFALNYSPINGINPSRLRITTINGAVTTPTYTVPPGGLQNAQTITVKRDNPANDLVLAVSILSNPSSEAPDGYVLASADMIVPPVFTTTTNDSSHYVKTNEATAVCFNANTSTLTNQINPDQGTSFDVSKTQGVTTFKGTVFVDPGPGSGVFTNPPGINTSQAVQGLVVCNLPPGRWNQWWSWKGYVEAWDVNIQTTVNLPHDNGKPTIQRDYPLSSPAPEHPL
jgi:hypothetical protein